MAKPPPPPPPPDPLPTVLPPRNPFIHNAAIAGIVICPLAMLLPPRKLDLRFLILAGGLSLSANQLAYAYTGKSIHARFTQRASSAFSVSSLPEPALRTQELIRQQKERKLAQEHDDDDDDREGQQRRQAEEEGRNRIAKLAEDVWMGGEGKDWQAKRVAEHARSFEEGKGMGGIIVDQIRDVLSGNWKPSSETVSEPELTRKRESKEKR